MRMATTTANELVDTPGDPVWRKIASWVLLVVFCLGLLLSIISVWARIEVLNTDAFVHTVSPLAADPDVQAAIADRVTTVISDWIRDDDATIAALGSDSILRGIGMSFLLDFVHRTVLDYVQSPSFQQQWDAAIEVAHRKLIDGLTGEREGAVTIEQGQLILDLAPMLADVQERFSESRLEIISRITISPENTQVVIFESERLAKSQRLIEQLKTLSIVLPIVTLIALAGCLLVALNKWGMVAGIGIGTTVAMVVLVILIAIGRRYLLDSLGPDVNREAATAVFDTVVRGVRQAARITAFIGLVVAAVGWVGTSSLVRRPSVVTTVRAYRNAILAALIIVPCLLILLAEDLEPVRVGGMVLIALTAMAMIVWISRMDVIATRSDTAPSG